MVPSPINVDVLDSFDVAVISSRELGGGLREALATHCAWIVVVRDLPREELCAGLQYGADADVIVMSRRRVLANLLPDAVCWRRDTLAAVLASGSGVPATFLMLRRAEGMGARVLHLPIAPPAENHPIGPIWADATHR